MSTPSVLLIRADASTSIGTGHVMRCIALAQAWQDAGGQATFAMTASTPALQTRLEAEGMNIAHLVAEGGSQDDARQTTALAQEMGACCVVADGYHFGAAYQQQIKAVGLKLLLVDDYGHADHYSADIVLNQNMTADEAMYVRREPYTRLLLGPRYVLLRREFWPWRDWQREVVPVARKVLVTLGGSDPDNVTLLVMQALHQIAVEDVEVVVLAGGSNPHYDTLHDTAQEAPYAVQLRQNVHNMPELMAWADLCIGAAGSTSWERCLLGLPSLLVVLADNQQLIAEHLHAQGIATNLGRTGSVSAAELARAIAQLAHDADARAEMMRRGQALVDGRGAERIAERIVEAMSV
jgi:UDP-2,4-diacetamido-2,4,6-trideoxy-beta-L-altropyranose hydrolase